MQYPTIFIIFRAILEHLELHQKCAEELRIAAKEDFASRSAFVQGLCGKVDSLKCKPGESAVIAGFTQF